MKEIIMEHGCHKNRIRLFLKFAFDQPLGDFVKALPGARWSQTKKCWHIPYDMELPDKLQIAFEELGAKLVYLNEFIELPGTELYKTNQVLPGLNAVHIEKIKHFMNW